MLVFLLHGKGIFGYMAEEPIHKVAFRMQQLSATHDPRVIPLDTLRGTHGKHSAPPSEHNGKRRPCQQGWENLLPDWLLIPNLLAEVRNMQCREVIFCGIHSIYLHYTPGSHAIKQQLQRVNKVNLIKLLSLPLFQLARFRAQGHSAACK